LIFSISAVHTDFCAWFDSRQLHTRKLVKVKSLGQLAFSSTPHPALHGCAGLGEHYEQRDRAGADDDAALALKEFDPFPAG
jgi:hypothetical protein